MSDKNKQDSNQTVNSEKNSSQAQFSQVILENLYLIFNPPLNIRQY